MKSAYFAKHVELGRRYLSYSITCADFRARFYELWQQRSGHEPREGLELLATLHRLV